MTDLTRRIVAAAAIAAATALGACGGDYVRPPVTEAVPDSASQSVGGFISYLKELVVASADLLEPVDVSGVTPPVDDLSEPDASI